MKQRSRFAVALTLGIVSGLLPVWAGPGVSTTCSVAASPNPVNQSMTSTVTGTVTPASGSVEGKGTISLRQHPSACKNVSFPGLGPALASGAPNSSGQFSASADTSIAGTFGVHNKYLGQGDGFANCSSPCLDLVVQPSACPASGLTISATFAAGEGSPPAGCGSTWTFRITVTNCGGSPINSVTAQGGTNGWTNNSKTLYYASKGSPGTRKLNNKNEVIYWSIGSLGGGESATLDIVVSGYIKAGSPDGMVLYLSGPWSAINADLGLKSDYTGRVTIAVDNTNSCP